jgi:hypothetical protein
MWIGQGKPTMAVCFRFVQRILAVESRRYSGLVYLIHNRI